MINLCDHKLMIEYYVMNINLKGQLDIISPSYKSCIGYRSKSINKRKSDGK